MVYFRPGSNALSTAKSIEKTMEDLSKRFPPGLKYTIVYNPTQFIQQSVDAVETTIAEAIILVVLVVILFLQTWRAAIIPIVAIPVSLIGTFFFMSIFGFTLNNLSLFGLVLAIGIVVDDAIVVVENVQRNIEAGLKPREASIKSMDEVGAALVAIALVLISVFVPSAFITGISGATFTNAPNAGAIFVTLDPFEKRAQDPQQSAAAIQGQLFMRLQAIKDGLIFVAAPPPVAGIGNAGGFRMMVEDRAGHGSQALQNTVYA